MMSKNYVENSTIEKYNNWIDNNQDHIKEETWNQRVFQGNNSPDMKTSLTLWASIENIDIISSFRASNINLVFNYNLEIEIDEWHINETHNVVSSTKREDSLSSSNSKYKPTWPLSTITKIGQQTRTLT